MRKAKDKTEGEGTLGKARYSNKVEKLSSVLTTDAEFQQAEFWIVGNTPLITHAWSEKARRQMLVKQTGAMKPGRESRDPMEDFRASLYEMGVENGNIIYGFPVTGMKNCILSVAHKDKGLARSNVMAALWLEAEIVRARPALAGAICDMPLVRIYGSAPEPREDMVKIGAGLNKVASLAYRGQFSTWAIKVRAKFNASVMKVEQLAYLIQEAGVSCGLGEWRNERRGTFGGFHLANAAEEAGWEAFAEGKGPMPKTNNVIKLAAKAEKPARKKKVA